MLDLVTENADFSDEEEEKKSEEESKGMSLQKLTSVDPNLMSEYEKLRLMAQTERKNTLNYARSLSIYQKIIVSASIRLLTE